MRYITATRIFSGKEFLPLNTILVLENENFISDITSIEAVEETNIEYFEGIITPGFINTHCHLELSHLKDLIKQHTGIVDFGLSVIKHRNDETHQAQLIAMQLADQEMHQQGIVAVGDISNTNLSIETKKQSAIYYHTFVELIALDPTRADVVFDAGKNVLMDFENNNLAVSFASHAPYSTSLKLIKQITDYCELARKPTSIHNQESKAEDDLFVSKTGDYLRLYETIKLTIDYFKATGKSSLQSVIPSLNNAVNTLLVHNTFTGENDVKVVQKMHSNLFWCLCPNANLYIENSLPDIGLLSSMSCDLTLGTDSLASNFKLSIMDEINTILQHYPNTSLSLILQAATYNGARFLGLENKFGLIAKNRNSGINLIEGNSGSFSVKKIS